MWGSRKQTTVALSSAEAEYVALSVASSEAWWLKKILSNFHIKTNEVILHEDNEPAIKNAHNPEVRKIKQLDLKKYFVKDKLKDQIIKIVYVSSTDQIADMFTKCLGNTLFIKFRDKVFNV
jgi:hypothetical protein